MEKIAPEHHCLPSIRICRKKNIQTAKGCFLALAELWNPPSCRFQWINSTETTLGRLPCTLGRSKREEDREREKERSREEEKVSERERERSTELKSWSMVLQVLHLHHHGSLQPHHSTVLPFISHTCPLSCYDWPSFFFFLLQTSTSPGCPLAAAHSHYRWQCHLHLSWSMVTPVWPHLSICPSPKQTKGTQGRPLTHSHLHLDVSCPPNSTPTTAVFSYMSEKLQESRVKLLSCSYSVSLSLWSWRLLSNKKSNVTYLFM